MPGGESWTSADCGEIYFSVHALKRLFERDFDEDRIVRAVADGEVVEDYPEAWPHPARLILYEDAGRHVHVVVAFEASTRRCLVVTLYEPDLQRWLPGFKVRRKP